MNIFVIIFNWNQISKISFAMHLQTLNMHQDVWKNTYKVCFFIIHDTHENRNTCIYCDDRRRHRLRDGARIKHEELTDVFKEVTLHVRAKILLSNTQVLVESSKG